MRLGRFKPFEIRWPDAFSKLSTAVGERVPEYIRPARTLPIRHERILFFGILLLGAVVRMSTSVKTSMWIDEGFALEISRLSFWHLWTVAFDSHPSLHYMLVKLADMLLDGEAAVRLPSILFGTASLGLIYPFARRLVGPVGGLIAMASLALSFTHLVQSNNGRNYALMLFFLTGAMYALFVLRDRLLDGQPILDRRHWRPFAAYFLCAVGAFYTHNAAIIFLFVLNAAFCSAQLVTAPRASIGFGLRLVAINAPALLLWLPWGLQMGEAAEIVDWMVQPDAIDALRTLLVAIGPNNTPWPFIIAVLAATALGGLMSLLISPRLVLAVAVPLVVFPLAVWIVGYLAQPIYMERIILPALIGASLALGVLAAHLRSPVLAYGLSGLALAGIALSTTSYLVRTPQLNHLGGQVLQDWRGAVSEQDDPATALLICDTFSWPTIAYYTNQSPLFIFAGVGETLFLEPDDWVTLYGMPATVRMASRGGDISPEIASWRQRVSRDWDSSAASYERVAFLKPDLFCKNDEPLQIRSAFAQSGYRLESTSLYAGVSVELYVR